MQRKATKKSTRAANADEKRFMAWVKQQPCIQCGASGVIVDHMYGSAFIHNKVLIGHWALLPLCQDCDAVKTNGSHSAYREKFKESQAYSWVRLITTYHEGDLIPDDVFHSIVDWNR